METGKLQIVISFGYSRSKYFEEVLEMCRSQAKQGKVSFTQNREGNNAVYILTLSDLALGNKVWQKVKTWDTAEFLINGVNITEQGISIAYTHETQSVIKGPREKLAQLSRYMLALLTGTVILFPAISGALKSPFVWDFALVGFWVFAILGFLFLATAFYLSNYVDHKTPHISTGVGNWSALLALIFLIIYVGINLLNDRMSQPEITSVEADPIQPHAGQWVKLTAQAVDEDGDKLAWNWTVAADSQGAPKIRIGSKRVVYWRTPVDEVGQTYAIQVGVKDDGDVEVVDSLHLTIGRNQLNELEKYVRDRISLDLARLVRNDPEKAELVNEAREALLSSALANLRSLEALRRDDAGLEEALAAFFEIPASELRQRQFRPCCSEWPGIFPLCRRGC